ncbi:hypothetical protein HY450_03295 [Candidatus Pacearchaeota archaeon]|nr:hypothetical protein [Candidatus Pacearchaeota archaeon]
MDSSKHEIGTTDAILGLLAIASEKLRERNSSGYPGIPQSHLYNTLHKLSLDENFGKYFNSLDFRAYGNNYYSYGLEVELALANAWSLIDVPPHLNYAIIVGQKRSRQRIKKLREKYEEKEISALEKMAEILVSTINESKESHHPANHHCQKHQ